MVSGNTKKIECIAATGAVSGSPAALHDRSAGITGTAPREERDGVFQQRMMRGRVGLHTNTERIRRHHLMELMEQRTLVPAPTFPTVQEGMVQLWLQR